MFNKDILKTEIDKYKEDLRQNGWTDDSKKLQAVMMFKNNWDIDADDFAAMLKKSIMNFSLIAGDGYSYRKKIIELAEKDPEEVHNMFEMLFDESMDVIDRIEDFKDKAKKLQKKINPKYSGDVQSEKAVTAYLWLKYPDEYFVYQLEVLQKLSDKLESDYVFKKGKYRPNLRNFLAFYKEIYDFIVGDSELTTLYREKIAGKKNCYNDPCFVTLTLDLAYGIEPLANTAENDNKGNYSPEYDDEEELTNDIVLNDENELDESLQSDVEPNNETYTKEMYLNEVFMTEENYDRIRATLEYKMNIILQGPPGVGKTYAAKRLAYSMMGEKDDDRICIVQFHQNFSYEDFVIGYKPKKEGGFELKYGSFYKFCKKAEKDPGKAYFFIIDEINRGNISKIFGELLMLIENEYRGNAGKELNVSLAYESAESCQPFCVPKNLYIIGMMNTADRSLALIDYALRRRFSFFEMTPAFETKEYVAGAGAFWEYVNGLDSKLLGKLIETTRRLNEDIKKSLGSGFMIGHSYFCGLEKFKDDGLVNRLETVVNCDILPTLREYWFDDDTNLENWEVEFSEVFEEYGQK